MASIKSNRQIYEKKYESLKQSFDEDTIKKDLQKDISSKKELDGKLRQIDQEINSLHHQSSQQAELELQQSRLQDEEKQVASIKGKHKDNLELLFDGKEIPQTNLKHNLEKIQKSLVKIILIIISLISYHFLMVEKLESVFFKLSKFMSINNIFL